MAALVELITQLDKLSADLGAAAEQTKTTDVPQGTAERLENIIIKLQGVKGDIGDTQHVYVQAYQTFLSDSVASFLSLSNEIGGDVQEQAALVKRAFDAQSAFIVVASESKPPAQGVLAQLLQPTSQAISDIQGFRDKRRSSPFFNHLSAVSDGIPALGWVTVDPKPGPFVKEMGDAGQFYSNRVLKDFKDKDVKHVTWVKALTKVFKDLHDYVMKYHTTGLVWNKHGKDAVPTAAAPPAAPAGGPPAPPPPPPPEAPVTGTDSGGDGSVARGALFAEINQGQDITKGLKKVTKDMQTHKNPALRQGPKPFGAPKPFKAVPAAPSKPAAAPAKAKKDPKKELQGKKWVVEYFDNNPSVEVNVAEMKQTVYIFKCTNSTIQVKGKVNSITLDGCKKVGLVLDNTLSAVDLVNCQSVKVQILERVPTVNIDKTDGAMVYLSKNSLDTQFVAAKSSEMNILVPQEDGDFKEYAVAEQFRTVYDVATKKIVTESLEVVA